MDILGLLIPAALLLGLVGLGAFIWALKSDQFEDLDGAAMRILLDDDAPKAPPQADDGERKGRSAARS
jgi:cbb3-type cytochrome oxidase maturation protein